MSRYFIVREKEREGFFGIEADSSEKAVEWMNKTYKREYEIYVELTKEEWDKISKGESIDIDNERINN